MLHVIIAVTNDYTNNILSFINFIIITVSQVYDVVLLLLCNEWQASQATHNLHAVFINILLFLNTTLYLTILKCAPHESQQLYVLFKP